MKILFVTNLYPPHFLGGYELLCQQTAHELKQIGHDITVLTSTHATGPIEEDDDGIHVVRRLELVAPFDRPGKVSLFTKLRVDRVNEALMRTAIREYQPELVFIWSQLRLSIACARVAEESSIGVAYTFNDPHLSGYLPAKPSLRPRRLMRFLRDRTLLRANTLGALKLENVTCISSSLKNQLLERGVSVPKADIIYQGVRLNHFPCKEIPGELHRPLRVLYAGQLHTYKGVHTLLQASLAFQAQHGRGSIELTIAGKGDEQYTQELKELASALPACRFLGQVAPDAMPATFREHDVLAFPSTWKEPFGLTHLEAMASGTTVVSTTEGGPAEFLVDGDNALTFPAEDANALALAFHRLYQDPALSRRIARRGREVVEQEFNLKRYVQSIDHFLARARQRGVAA